MQIQALKMQHIYPTTRPGMYAADAIITVNAALCYSLIFASSLCKTLAFRLQCCLCGNLQTYSWSLNSEYSSSPTLIGLPPNCHHLISLCLLQTALPFTCIAYLRYQHPVSRHHAHRHTIPLLVHHTRSHREYFRLIKLFHSTLG